MLVLTRKPTQSLIIGNDGEIIITVLSIDWNGSSVRIGIEAPRNINIARDELLFSKNRALSQKNIISISDVQNKSALDFVSMKIHHKN